MTHLQELAHYWHDKYATELNIISSQPVHGGDINECYKLSTNQGLFFLKTNSNIYPGMFRNEFHGLFALKNTQAIRIPEPILTIEFNDEQWLLLEWLERGSPAKDFWKEFACDLVTLHRNTNKQFGFHEDNYIGSLIQENSPTSTWHEFYSMRIMNFVKRAVGEGKLEKNWSNKAEKACEKFASIFPNEPPSLLHGDLWGGNYMVHESGYAAIYDPAVYYGHREMDLGMSLLFGGFDRKFYDHYNEAFPLEKNWRERVDLCQLYPLLVHLLLFGGHYRNSVIDILTKYS